LPVLAIRRDIDDFAIEGERVIAIGSPLNQSKILTSGIISKVEKGVIISDVNINQGNSGGPLINMDSEVIAINTFGDFPKRGGPGISGSIRIDKIFDLIDNACVAAISEQAPCSDRLPIMPKDIYPLWALEYAATLDKRETKPYCFEVGNFEIKIQTPPYIYREKKLYELRLAKNREKREKKGRADQSETYNPFDDLKSWYQYVGQYVPVVTIMVIPKIGQTSGSTWGNLLGAFAAGMSGSHYYGSYKYEFKADLKDMRFLINKTQITEIQRGMVFIPLNFMNANFYGTYKGEDIARAGMFVFPYEFFQPDNGIWPSLSVEIVSIEKPNQPYIVNITQRLIERVWLDFEPYREKVKGRHIKLTVTR